MAFTPDGAFVYVPNAASNNVSVIATATNTVVATIPVGMRPQGVAIAGNSAPTVTCEGFDPPMDVPVTVKKNRALPLKALLFDEMDILVTDVDVTAFPIVQVLFDSGFGGDPVDVTADALPAGQSSEGNNFSFDVASSRWKYNLKTKNHGAPGTYTITMVSGDESEYRVDPTCTAIFVVE